MDVLTYPRKDEIKLSLVKFRELRDFIYEQSGIFFQEGKKYLLENRLRKRIEELNMGSFDEYVAYLKGLMTRKEELKNIYNLITINETYFFRFEKQLDVFAKKLFPSLIEERKTAGTKRVKIWSAASSSGEEIYSIAMILKENLNNTLSLWQIDLFGTDISQRILKAAEEGLYGGNSFRGNVSNYYKTKYFTQDNGKLRVNDDLKKMTNFYYLNLNDISSIQRNRGVDFLFCRNVLIYFDNEVKKRVVRGFYDTLNHGGYLFLGEAESLHGISSAFKVEHFPGVFVYKKE